MPTALIADDEPHLVDYLRAKLATLWPELRIVATVANGTEALASIAAHRPDIAFLDIRMPGRTGLQVAQQLQAEQRPPRIVFVTAFDQYAVEAFEREAVDYLLKPFGDERLQQTIDRLKRRLAGDAPSPDLAATLAALARALPGAAAPAGRLAWIRASAGNEVRLISVDDVCYFEANDKYTSVFTADGEALIRTPLKELVAQLDPDRFWQVHRGTVVNLAHIATTTRDLAGRVTIALRNRRERVAVSRAYAHLFKQM